MSWHFSAALEAAYSAALSLDGKPSALWSSMPFAPDDSCSDKMMGIFHRSRFGTMCAHSMAGPGAGLLAWCRAVSRARTSPPPAGAPGSAARAADSGGRWRASLAKFDPATRSWKTHQSSLLGGWEPFSGIWPRWGMMRAGECWAQSTRAPRISARESGLWQTPVADDAVERAKGKFNSRGEAKLSAQVLWQTPTVQDANGRDRHNQRDGSTRPSLLGQVRLWPTPQARDHFPPHSAAYVAEKRAQGHGMSNLNDAVAGTMLPTPLTRDWRSGKASQATHDRNSRPLSEVIGGQLNPNWVEWLMGWPIGWTGCEPLETGRFRPWCDSHGICWGKAKHE